MALAASTPAPSVALPHSEDGVVMDLNEVEDTMQENHEEDNGLVSAVVT
jgi:hypothetical protein